MDIDIQDTKEYGVIVYTDDITGDEFDDYLSESIYAFFNIGYEGGRTIFYFGLASSLEKVEKIVEEFKDTLNKGIKK
ncbi:MAG: hypothetical protein V2I33_05270 [Kangiellaceae bacterium]|jgi:hypothetical protein|nr:hypothetical protein [Kangiellaceae bacterium]